MILRLTDAGDGSTTVRVTFPNGEVRHVNGDVPYDGYYEVEFDAEGKLVDEHTVIA